MTKKRFNDSAKSPHRERSRYSLICAAIIVLTLLLKLPSLKGRGFEDDERIYWELTRNWISTGAYSLQNSPILSQLPPSIYDKPFFHHPPLLPILMVPFVATNHPIAAILISWMGHVLAIVGVAMICWTWRRRAWRATSFFLWLPVLAVAMDPLLTFCSRKLWTDGLAGGLAVLAMGLYVYAAHHRSWRWAAAGGAILGLAGLAKLPALLVMPAAGLFLLFPASVGGGDESSIHHRSSRSLSRKSLLILAGILPTGLILLPWFVVFYGHYHQLLPSWIHPDAQLRAVSPLVERAMSQPWHYYFSQSVMVAPVVLVILVGYIFRRRLLRSPRLAIPLLWVSTVVVALTFEGLRGQGMQLRFITPAAGGLYAMLAGLLSHVHPRKSLLGLAVLLAILYGTSAMGFYLSAGLQYDEIVSMPEMLWRMWSRQ